MIESIIYFLFDFFSRKAIGCQDGTLSMYQISTMTVQCLHEQLYAYRHSSMTDVLVHQLNTNEKSMNHYIIQFFF